MISLTSQDHKLTSFSIDCHRGSILVVDDEESIKKLLKKTLSKMGFKVNTASNGEEGLRLFREHSFELVLVDLNMPKLSGEQLLREIKKLSPATEVIVITGYASVDSAVECLGKLGAYAYITKPLHPISMLDPIVTKALERRELCLENQRLIAELKELNAHLERKVREKTNDLEEAYKTLSLSYNELNHYISALININQLLIAITSSGDLNFIVENVLQYAESITDSGNALLIRTTDEFVIKDFYFASKPFKELNLKKADTAPSFLRGIIESGKELTFNKKSDFNTCGYSTDSPCNRSEAIVERFSGVPLKKGDTTIGLLAVFNKHEPYSEKDSELLTLLANGATVAIINAELTKQVQKKKRVSHK